MRRTSSTTADLHVGNALAVPQSVVHIFERRQRFDLTTPHLRIYDVASAIGYLLLSHNRNFC